MVILKHISIFIIYRLHSV